MPYKAWLKSPHSGSMAGICQEKNVKEKHAFGAALHTARESRKLTQDALGLAQSNISRLESGARVPSWERVEALAELLRVHPATLFVLSYFDGTTDAQQELLKRLKAELDEILGPSR